MSKTYKTKSTRKSKWLSFDRQKPIRDIWGEAIKFDLYIEHANKVLRHSSANMDAARMEA